jgi:arylsulfatase A-like enzyme
MRNLPFPDIVSINSTLIFLIFPLLMAFIPTERQAGGPPNIILIVADDLGYGELGCYGQTFIETPHIDAMAKDGIRFSQFYSGSAVCAPARCVLLTGKHSGKAYIRGNDEWAERGAVWDYAKGAADPNLEGQRPLPANTLTLGRVLQNAGYSTGCVGKWGLGAPLSEGRPNLQGFDFFYGYNCQRQAHNLYPPFQWKNEEKIPLRNAVISPNTKLPEGLDPNRPESYAMFSGQDYAPDLQLNEALGFVERSAGKKPFFLLYASPLPHVSLQATEKWVGYYQKKLGPEPPYLGEKGYLPNYSPMATYAAMISILDEQVGAIRDKINALGIGHNTLIIFTSDNGPSFAGGVDPEKFKSAGPFPAEYGRSKGFLYEGGIRVPMIACWPGKIKPQRATEHLSGFQDFLPTFCAAARSAPPTDIDGINFLPTLKGKRQKGIHPYLYWEIPEYGGQQALRKGPWKAIRTNLQQGPSPVKLYHLEKDPREQNDLSGQYPDIAAEMLRLMLQEHQPPEIEKFKIKGIGAGSAGIGKASAPSAE